MALITLRNVDAGYGGPHLIENANLVIDKGERIALVGRNGCGKSTFMKLLLGLIEPLGGELEKQKQLRVSILEQEVPDNITGSITDVILSGEGAVGRLLIDYFHTSHQAEEGIPGAAEKLHEIAIKIEDSHGWAVSTRAEMLISKLKLSSDNNFENLSAGMKRKVLLAKAFISEPDILLLDEPTNHLDIESVTLMEEILINSPATILFVTHDRAFLKRVASRILELDRTRLRSYECNYETYLKRREEILKAEQAQAEQFDKKLAEEEVWIRKGIQGRRTRNEGRVRALKAMREERRERKQQTGNAKLNVQQGEASGRLVAELKKVSFGYENEKHIVEDLTTTIYRGDRIGIIGPNGVGKSTLLKLILGQLTPDSGNIKLGTNLQISYFDQLHNQLDDSKTVVENVADGYMTINTEGNARNAIGYLQDFLFPALRCKSLVSALSGGERTRLLLAKLFAKPSNILVLDEPTNNLDLETIELLEEQLADYQGTILLVSHDRDFINNVATATLVFGSDGEISEYVGGYDDFLRQRKATQQLKSVAKAAPKDVSEKPKQRKLTYQEKKELEKIPSEIEKLEATLADIHSLMAEPEFYKQSGDKIAETNTKLELVQSTLDEKYARWELLESI